MSTLEQPKKTLSLLYMISLIIIWWSANSYYAVHSQNLLRDANTPFLFAELTFMQLYMGLLFSILYHRCESRRSEASVPKLSSQIQHLLETRSLLPLLIGFCHFIGTAFTNASYAVLGSTSTLVWKLSEPFSVVLLKWSLLGKRTSTFSLVGVVHLVVGVMIFSKSALSGLAVSPIIVANIAYPARNVASKLYQDSQTDSLSGAERFLRIHLCCFPFILLGIMAKGIQYGIHVKLLYTMTENALLFNMYQFASLELLDILDALTHAVGNSLKRVFGVILSAFLTGDTILRHQQDGLALACVGVLFYFVGERGNKTSQRTRSWTKGIGVLISLLVTIDLTTKLSKSFTLEWASGIRI